MNKLLYVLSFLLLFSCSGESTEVKKNKEKSKTDTSSVENPLDEDTLDIKSDYKMDNVDPKGRKEFKENLVEIEKKHGIQWDFCTCVVANDSINKAFQDPNISDADFDRASDRFDIVAEKCKAFQIQNPQQTPEERARHEKKVRDCLKAAK